MKNPTKNTEKQAEEIKDEQLDNVQGGSKKGFVATDDLARKGKKGWIDVSSKPKGWIDVSS